MTKICPLIVILQPRDISEFRNAVERELSKVDKLWIRYYPQSEAYQIGRDEFLDAKRYTHMVLLPDDLIVTMQDYNQLVQDIERSGYNVISGYCNFDNVFNKEWSNISINNLPPLPAEGLVLEDYNLESLRDLEKLKATVDSKIISVKYAGFPFTFINRNVVKRIEFKTPNNCCYDNFFSLKLDQLGIQQYVDLRVRMIHLRISSIQDEQNLQVGRKSPELFWQWKTSQ